jgi:2-oxoglutarate-dependent dioxygenase
LFFSADVASTCAVEQNARMNPVPVTGAQVEAFKRDGVVGIGEVIKPEEAAQLAERLHRLLYDASGALDRAVWDFADRDGDRVTSAVLQLTGVQNRDQVFACLAARDDLRASASALLGSEARLYRDQGLSKLAGSTEVFLHQDNHFFCFEPADAVTLWIALDDAVPENGCLCFVRGSHTAGALRHEPARGGTSTLLEANAGEITTEPLVLPAGHGSFHHCHTLHRSSPNRTKAPRRAYALVYAAAGARSPVPRTPSRIRAQAGGAPRLSG